MFPLMPAHEWLKQTLFLKAVKHAGNHARGEALPILSIPLWQWLYDNFFTASFLAAECLLIF